MNYLLILQEALQKNMRTKSLSGDTPSAERRRLPSNNHLTNGAQRQYLSSESLTSTEELMAGE